MIRTQNAIFKEIEKEIKPYRSNPNKIINPVDMAEDHGIKTRYADFSSYEQFADKLGYYRIDINEEDGSFKHTICCRQDIHSYDPSWLSFTLAHELAHYFIFKRGIFPWPEKSAIVDAISKAPPKTEKEIACDLFAREMLMPESLFRDTVDFHRAKGIRNQDTIIECLADKFKVPNIHARQRGIDLEVFEDAS